LTIKIYLDAGHGGKDSGAVGNGLYEKNIALDLVKRIAAKLHDYTGIEVLQTRTTDVFLELTERTAKANKWGADFFISVHLNSATNSQAKGFETFIYNGELYPKTVAFQNTLHAEIFKQISDNATDRGKKRANFHVLREAHASAILVENLFISNSSDTKLLKSATFLDKLAQGYVNGLEKFLGLVKKPDAPTTQPKPSEPNKPTGKLYQVIAGTFSSVENAERQIVSLKKDGFNAYYQVSGRLYQVVAGTFSSLDNAKKQIKNLNEKKYSAYIKVKE
jgi:N-acetylmuramoyl-L-alanine amidase